MEIRRKVWYTDKWKEYIGVILMMKKIISAILALAMLLSMTACAQDNSEPTDSSSASDSSQVNTESENSSKSDADSSASDSSSENSTDDSSTVNSETTSATTTTTKNSTTTTTTKAQATTTTKQAVATTKATVKAVQSTKATVKVTAKSTTKATVKATQPAVNTAAYVNNIIADINKMFPESQFNKALYDKFERLCKGVPTEQDKKDISEAVCNYAIRKFNGKSGNIICYTTNGSTRTLTAKQPVNIKINRTFTRDDAHLGVGNDTSLYYAAYKNAEQNYKGINTFIQKCFLTMDRGIGAIIKQGNPPIEIYYSIDNGGWQSGVNHNAYYMWFCHKG